MTESGTEESPGHPFRVAETGKLVGSTSRPAGHSWVLMQCPQPPRSLPFRPAAFLAGSLDQQGTAVSQQERAQGMRVGDQWGLQLLKLLREERLPFIVRGCALESLLQGREGYRHGPGW